MKAGDRKITTRDNKTRGNKIKTKDSKIRNSYYLRIFQKNRLLLSICILVSILTSAGSAAIALLLKNIIDITVSKDMTKFTRTLLFNLVFLAVFALVCYANSLLSKFLMKKVISKMRSSVFNGIFRRSYQDFYEVNTADYISVLTNDIKLVEENYMQPLMGIIENMMSFLFTLALLIFISPIITAILFIGMILMFVIPGMIGTKLQSKQDALSAGYSLFTSKIKDLFSGFEVIKSFHLFGHMKEQFQQENELLTNKKFQSDRLFVLNETVSQFLAVFMQIITIFAAAFLVIKGDITMGTLIAIMQLAGSFVMPLVFLMQNFPKIQSVAPIMKRMQQFDDYIELSKGNMEPEFKEKVKITDLSYAYKEEQPVLEDINLEIMKGKKYVIVGESGCGKTTFVKLLMGYYSDYKGEISYDGYKLRECDAGKISELVSIIHQNVYMFDKTIKENICLFQEYPKEILDQALIQSGVDKFLPLMQDDLETMVGENGANLSGGQRQRIAIARSLVKGTPILILDEGTSALDQQTSNEIEQYLLQNKDLTLITITHKLNEELLSSYDQVIFMDKGHIVESGSYKELYSAKKSFYRFCVA